MGQLILVALGGATGAALRFIVSAALSHEGEAFPQGTFVVNLLGSFLLPVVAELAPDEGSLRLLLGTGLLGGFTTYSAFNLETMRLLGGEDWLRGVLYVAATVLCCLLAGAAGAFAVRLFR